MLNDPLFPHLVMSHNLSSCVCTFCVVKSSFIYDTQKESAKLERPYIKSSLNFFRYVSILASTCFTFLVGIYLPGSPQMKSKGPCGQARLAREPSKAGKF